MSDHVSKEKRSEMMRLVKSKHTSLEQKVTKAIWKKGLRFRKNVLTLPGKPDIAIKKRKKVVFIDSCFWHGCELHSKLPKTNTEFWNNKILRNRNRDKHINELYKEMGWNIFRIWEHDIKKDLNKSIAEIYHFLSID